MTEEGHTAKDSVTLKNFDVSQERGKSNSCLDEGIAMGNKMRGMNMVFYCLNSKDQHTYISWATY